MAVTVLKEKCRGCTKCVKACPFQAITMEDRKAVIGTACTGCGQCVDVCPFQAIAKTEEENGKKDLSAWHGVWVFAEQRDGKLMRVAAELLGEGRKLADAVGCGLSAVLCGDRVEGLADELFAYGADTVYYAAHPNSVITRRMPIRKPFTKRLSGTDPRSCFSEQPISDVTLARAWRSSARQGLRQTVQNWKLILSRRGLCRHVPRSAEI